ncbi:MAG: SIR2 family protein [Neisseriaceae bacterium]|nr:SIR2 family protein [Neisseriaceae bacterium]
MKIQDFIKQYDNYPILFVGAGLSRRYLKESYNWNDLLKKIADDIYGDSVTYADIKIKYEDRENNTHDFYKIATQIEDDFNKLMNSTKKTDKINKEKFSRFKDLNREKSLNDEFSVSYLKLYIAELTKNLKYKDEKSDEIELLKKTKNKFSSIITTNYDGLIEDLLDFKPIVGNDLICTNPIQSVYKIHGCHTQADSIIITKKDSEEFQEKFLLIKAQLLSLFLHRPIIFIGYNFGDKNIIDILNTIFLFVR